MDHTIVVDDDQRIRQTIRKRIERHVIVGAVARQRAIDPCQFSRTPGRPPCHQEARTARTPGHADMDDDPWGSPCSRARASMVWNGSRSSAAISASRSLAAAHAERADRRPVGLGDPQVIGPSAVARLDRGVDSSR